MAICGFFALCAFGMTTDPVSLVFMATQTEEENMRPGRPFRQYLQYCKEKNSYDMELLQNICLAKLQTGINSKDQNKRMHAILGAGLSASTRSLDMLISGFNCNDPNAQLMALHFLTRINDDRIDSLLIKAMSSPSLVIRLEAAYILAERKHPAAVGQIESLMHRVPPYFKSYFPPFYALIGTPEATSILKELLNDRDLNVRLEATYAAGAYQKDHLTEVIRKKATHHHVAEQEMSAWSLGKLKDSGSLSVLKRLADSKDVHVRLSAARALVSLGDGNYEQCIVAAAKERNLFAIAMLNNIKGNEDFLASLLSDPDETVRLNATVALLERKDNRCLKGLRKILISDNQDLAFQLTFSPGHSLRHWKILNSGAIRARSQQVDLALSLNFKEYILKMAIGLEEKAFLSVVKMIFDEGQNQLVPQVIMLLENLATREAIDFLKTNSEKIGAPLIRNYCNLALFRLKEEGPYRQRLDDWLLHYEGATEIIMRPIIPKSMLPAEFSYELTPEENSRLLIDIYMALIERQSIPSIITAVRTICRSREQTMYTLAGLLLRATE